MSDHKKALSTYLREQRGTQTKGALQAEGRQILEIWNSKIPSCKTVKRIKIFIQKIPHQKQHIMLM